MVELRLATTDQNITVQGDQNNGSFFLVQSGQYDVEVRDYCDKEQFSSKRVRTISAGDLFGEVAVLYDCNRTATVKSKNFGTYGELPERATKLILMEHPYFGMVLKTQSRYVYDDKL